MVFLLGQPFVVGRLQTEGARSWGVELLVLGGAWPFAERNTDLAGHHKARVPAAVVAVADPAAEVVAVAVALVAQTGARKTTQR